MKKMFVLLFISMSSIAFSQTNSYEIQGVLKSKIDSTFLEAATVHLEKIKDSSIVTYTISNKDGKFQLSGKSYEKQLRLVVSFVGFSPYSKILDLSKSPINLKTIELDSDKNILDEVVLKSNAPITIKKDTLEFNVKSFKTHKNANVEELLKKLPGVEVDEAGKITVNGKPVNKILVNGKPFFGDDPTIATKNLSKEIIEKVQVTDTKSKSEAFAGEKGDQENKTINLTIKKENNRGVFGRLAAGKGTDDLYEFAGIASYFDNDTRVSLLAGGNNINSPGFSFGEIREMYGGGGSISVNSSGGFSIDGLSFGLGGGLTTSQNFGATFADSFGKSLEFNTDYFYSNADNRTESSSNRETFLPDGSSFFTNSKSNGRSDTKNHKINADLDIKIDSTFLVNIKPSFSFNNIENASQNNSESLDGNNNLINQSSSRSLVTSESNNFSNRISLTKRLKKKGSFLKLRIDNQIDETNSDNRFNSDLEIFGNNPSQEIRNQVSDQENTFNSFISDFTYRLPLIKEKLTLDFSYNYRKDKRINQKNTFDIDALDNRTFNSDLSTDFVYENIRSTPSIGFNYSKKDFNFSLETGFVTRTLRNQDALRPLQSLERDFNAVELRGNLYYKINQKTSVYSGFNSTNRPPQLNQLQPYTDVSNPLNIVTGNPELQPTTNNSIYVGFNSYNFQKGTGFYGFLNASMRDNVVVSKSTIDENLVRNTTYENVDGAYSINANASYSFKVNLDSIRSIKLRAGVNTNRNKAVNFYNDVKYNSINTSLSPNVGFTFNWKNAFEISPRYTLALSKSDYDISQFEDQNFTRHQVRIRTRTFAPKKLEWRNDINYQYNPNVADGFQKSSWFWNATVTYSIFNDKASLSLKAYDLLNQNTNARRRATQNYIEDSESLVLNRYFMLSFSWKFNTMGTKRKQQQNFIIFD